MRLSSIGKWYIISAIGLPIWLLPLFFSFGTPYETLVTRFLTQLVGQVIFWSGMIMIAKKNREKNEAEETKRYWEKQRPENV